MADLLQAINTGINVLDFISREHAARQKERDRARNIELFNKMVNEDTADGNTFAVDPGSGVPVPLRGILGVAPPAARPPQTQSRMPESSPGQSVQGIPTTQAPAVRSPREIPQYNEQPTAGVEPPMPSAGTPTAPGMAIAPPDPNLAVPQAAPPPAPSAAPAPPQHGRPLNYSINMLTGALTISTYQPTAEGRKKALDEYYKWGMTQGYTPVQLNFHAQMGGYGSESKPEWEGRVGPMYLRAQQEYRKYFDRQKDEKGLSPTQVEYLAARAAEDYTGGWAPDSIQDGILAVPRKAWETEMVEQAKKMVGHDWADVESTDKAIEAGKVQTAQNRADYYTKPLTGDVLAHFGGAQGGETWADIRSRGMIYMSDTDIAQFDNYNNLFTTVDNLGAIIKRIYTSVGGSGGLKSRIAKYAHMTLSDLLQLKSDPLAIAIADFRATKTQLFGISKAFGNTGNPSDKDMSLTIEGFPDLEGLPDTRDVAFSKLSVLRNGAHTNLQKLIDKKKAGYTPAYLGSIAAPREGPDVVRQGRVGGRTGIVQSSPGRVIEPAAPPTAKPAAPAVIPGGAAPLPPGTSGMDQRDAATMGLMTAEQKVADWWSKLSPANKESFKKLTPDEQIWWRRYVSGEPMDINAAPAFKVEDDATE